MITRLRDMGRKTAPCTDALELKTESDVEQKVIYPFLTNSSYLGFPASWVRTKDYMEPTEIDKGAGKRLGYIPDYSIWSRGFPLLIVEAKSPDETIQKALREAHLYANRINNRYPPGVNPISFVLACNGEQFGLAPADSESDLLIANVQDLQPGTEILSAFKSALATEEFEKRAIKLSHEFQSRRFHRIGSFLNSDAFNEQLGVNRFAQQLFPLITRYFGSEADEATDDIIEYGYVTSDERTEYGAVLETYLKDRERVASNNVLQPIVTSKQSASGLSTEIQRFGQRPHEFGRVQLIVGAVGAGKSIFIRRFYKKLMPAQVRERTKWSFINFNSGFNDPASLERDIAAAFIESFCALNGIEVRELEFLEKVFRTEMNQFDKGPAKLLIDTDRQRYNQERYFRLKQLMESDKDIVSALARHFTGERGIGLVVVFDNVDKRSRDLQLAIFAAAQWFKSVTRGLVIVNLRDTTFEAHRDEKPLDAFINAVNFYIRPPRFSLVLQKRLEVLLSRLTADIALEESQNFVLESGIRVSYSSNNLKEFLTSINSSLFEKRGSHVGAALESLVARNARRALGMFGDIISSPHIPTSQIASISVGGPTKIQEDRIIRALMRGRYKMFANRGPYVRNILSVVRCRGCGSS